MLHIHLVRSKEVHAEILKIDYEKALEMPGVETVITSEDVPGEDGFGVYYHDRPVLAKEKSVFMANQLWQLWQRHLKMQKKQKRV